MPPKKTRSAAQKMQLAAVRHGSSFSSSDQLATIEKLPNMLGDACNELLDAEEQIAELVSLLELEQASSKIFSEGLQLQHAQNAELSAQLATEKAKSAGFLHCIAAEQARYGELYCKYRVERRRRQRGEKRKLVLEAQIQALKDTAKQTSAQLKTMTRNASRTIDSLINVEKQNATLKNELSQALQRCKAELSESRNTVLALTKKLGQSKALSKALSKCHARAHAVKENAVRKAREVALKEKSVHRLIHKGAYTKETRNMVRLLVQSGCSQDSVNRMIHAVLRMAGVSVIGKISRRSVSRFIREGFYAAQVQLGYEMDKAGSM
jgi:chromosome segregation ATPase